jgi:hypothetical protein
MLRLDLPRALPRPKGPMPGDQRKHDPLQLHHEAHFLRQRQGRMATVERGLASPELIEELGRRKSCLPHLRTRVHAF